jgi:hypothetical protein
MSPTHQLHHHHLSLSLVYICPLLSPIPIALHISKPIYSRSRYVRSIVLLHSMSHTEVLSVNKKQYMTRHCCMQMEVCNFCCFFEISTSHRYGRPTATVQLSTQMSVMFSCLLTICLHLCRLCSVDDVD